MATEEQFLICRNAVTMQKRVTDVCFPVCTVPPFLPLTVAVGPTLSENVCGWQPPLSSLQPYPSWSTPTPFSLQPAQLCWDTNPVYPGEQ